MRVRISSRVLAGAASFLISTAAGAQGSWLPYGRNGAADIAVSPSGVVWLIGKEPQSIRTSLILAETRFHTPRGLPSRVGVDLNGFPWLVNADGSVWHYERNSSGKEDWVKSPLEAIDIAVGANGAVWAIDTQKRVVRLSEGKWESIGGSANRIAVDPSGNPWIVETSGNVSQWTGSAWANHGGAATDISIGPDGTAYILGTNPRRGGFEVLRLAGSTWERLVGGGGIAISAGSKAVFIAQDTTTYLVLSSENARLRAETAEPGETRMASNQPPLSPAAGGSRSDGDKGSSLPLPSAGTVGAAAGLIGSLVGAASKVVPPPTAAVAVVPVPTPSVGAVAGVVGTAVSAATSGLSGSGEATAQAQQRAQLDKPATPEVPKISGPRPSLMLPKPGSLRCPIVGDGEVLERICEIGRDALKLALAPPADCEEPSFAESRNGGECWTCPATFARNSASPIEAEDACVRKVSDSSGVSTSIATLVKGCALTTAPPGYGTPFRGSPDGSGCYVCPVGLQPSLSALRNISRGNLGACFGKAKEMIVWQLTQYPEAGAYRFMPGLLNAALSNPRAVDEFLSARAGGDVARKREMWSKMIADPSGSAELKALLFASLVDVARNEGADSVARETLREFESYITTRRSHVADEALRMYRKAVEIDSRLTRTVDSAGAAVEDAVGTALTDFKTYAWSAALPDSAAAEFVLATAALSEIRGLTGIGSIVEAKAFKGADVAKVATTLLGGAMKASKGVMTRVARERLPAEYESYAEEMKLPVRIKDLVDSRSPEIQQSLLLYWSLATSAYTAADRIGSGALTGAELCNSNGWTAEQCASAKSMIEAAAKAAGHTN